MRKAPGRKEHDRQKDDLAFDVKGLRDAQHGKRRHNKRCGSNKELLQTAGKGRGGRAGNICSVFVERSTNARQKLCAQSTDHVAQSFNAAHDCADKSRKRIVSFKLIPAKDLHQAQQKRLQEDADDVGSRRFFEIDVRVEFFAVGPDVLPIASLERNKNPGKHKRDGVDRERKKARARVRPLNDAAGKVLADLFEREKKHARCRPLRLFLRNAV